MANYDWKTFRDKIIKNPYYLGAPQALDKVTWARFEREEVLVSAEVAAAHQSAADDAGTNFDHGGADLPDLGPASLLLVAKVSPDDCWLTPCGSWKGPTAITPTFADLKLNCRLVAPEDPTFANDFRVVLRNLETLISRVETKGYERVGVFDPKERPKTSIKLRHVVFEEKDLTDGNEEGNAFQLRDWPAKSLAAQNALESMDSTHRVNPIRTYDIGGNLIPPSQYMSTLQGAVVRVEITISHWGISKGSRDAYAADIDTLRVIVPAPLNFASGSAKSPHKKNTSIPTKDYGPSLTKKTVSEKSILPAQTGEELYQGLSGRPGRGQTILIPKDEKPSGKIKKRVWPFLRGA
ncbi:hypothetical protein MVEN_00596400 [Mycena venus]|uniref:Uncharacterized protein n=1 Tax=Mycena venus TaxID=2733690 RepID=A0A8H7D7P5_9AGAR|nr:hypothetical protein MVEN_00596400 [Mycena venus]